MPYKHKIPIYTENLNLTGAYFRHQSEYNGWASPSNTVK